MTSKNKFVVPSIDEIDSKNSDSSKVAGSLFRSRQRETVCTNTETDRVPVKQTQVKKDVVSQSKIVAISKDKPTVSASGHKKNEGENLTIPGTSGENKVNAKCSESSDAGTVTLDGPVKSGPAVAQSNAIIVSSRQRLNPVLKSIRNVAWQFGDIVADFQMSATTCALYLSLKYHSLRPDYIHQRLKQLGHSYTLRVLLVQVDLKDPHHCLQELATICILSDCTLILAFTIEEAGRYLETYKAFENKPPDMIMEKTEGNYLAQFTDVLTAVRKVNKTDATTLMSSFGTFEKLCEASEEDLSLCPGFGPQKAQRVFSVLREPFLKSKKKSPVKTSGPQAKVKKTKPSSK